MAKATKDFPHPSSPQVTTPEELRDFLENAVQNHPKWFYRPFGAMENAPIIDMLNIAGVFKEIYIFSNPKTTLHFSVSNRYFAFHTYTPGGRDMYPDYPRTPVLISAVSAPILLKVLFGISPSGSSICAGRFSPAGLEWLLDTYGNPDLQQDILKRLAPGSDELHLFANFITPDTLRIYAENHAKVRYNEHCEPYMTGSPEAVVAALHKNPSLLNDTSFPAVQKFFNAASRRPPYFVASTPRTLRELEKILSAYTTPATPAAPATPAPM